MKASSVFPRVDRDMQIGKSPLLYRLRPEIGEEARLEIVGWYVILFRMKGKVERIERVVFGGRDLPLLLQFVNVNHRSED